MKEYLTSPRLARSPDGEVSRFRIDLEPAHMIITQACLATLLQMDQHAGNSDAILSPLVKYAAEHWVDHAQFGKLSLCVWEQMDDLFDNAKPRFAAWLRVHNMDKPWVDFSPFLRDGVGSPLYYAAFCGFYDMAEHLIAKHPEQVHARGGRNQFPLPAALYKKHLRVAHLLYRHGAAVDVRGIHGNTPLRTASTHGQIDIMLWLLDHGADVNARSDSGFTPLSSAAHAMDLEAVQVLLEHNANINIQDNKGQTPLCWVLSNCPPKGKFVDMVRLLLDRGADPNICNDDHSTPLHQASSRKLLEAARLLLSCGAKVDEKDGRGKTPFQLAASDEMAKLLLEHGAVPQP